MQMRMVLFNKEKRFVEKKFVNEADFERLIVNNYKMLFGKNTLLIDSKRKVATQSLGGAIPDFYLLNLNDPQSPDFYLVEVELSSHDFYRHIFPQITKYFAFFKNQGSHDDLLKKLHDLISTDEILNDEFKQKSGADEIYKYLKDMLDNSQNILIILDNEIAQLPEVVGTYTETWGKNVKTMFLKEYTHNDESIYMLWLVRFDGWQNTIPGEREVQKSLRKTLLKYQLHKD
jgi:hypothetical protein